MERTFSIRKVILTEKLWYGLLIRASGAPSWPKVRAAMSMEQHLPNPFFQLIQRRAIRVSKKKFQTSWPWARPCSCPVCGKEKDWDVPMDEETALFPVSIQQRDTAWIVLRIQQEVRSRAVQSPGTQRPTPSQPCPELSGEGQAVRHKCPHPYQTSWVLPWASRNKYKREFYTGKKIFL